MGLYRLCLGVSVEGKTGVSYAPELISHLLKSLSISLCIRSYPRYEVCSVVFCMIIRDLLNYSYYPLWKNKI